MKMKSERPLLVNGVPQTEFETSDQHGKELIAKGLAVEVVMPDAAVSPAPEAATTPFPEASISNDGALDNGSKTLTIAELRDALTAKSIAFDPAAKKADLQALLDAAH